MRILDIGDGAKFTVPGGGAVTVNGTEYQFAPDVAYSVLRTPQIAGQAPFVTISDHIGGPSALFTEKEFLTSFAEFQVTPLPAGDLTTEEGVLGVAAEVAALAKEEVAADIVADEAKADEEVAKASAEDVPDNVTAMPTAKKAKKVEPVKVPEPFDTVFLVVRRANGAVEAILDVQGVPFVRKASLQDIIAMSAYVQVDAATELTSRRVTMKMLEQAAAIHKAKSGSGILTRR